MKVLSKRTCSKCREEKLVSEFYRYRKRNGIMGRKSICKQCEHPVRAKNKRSRRWKINVEHDVNDTKIELMKKKVALGIPL